MDKYKLEFPEWCDDSVIEAILDGIICIENEAKVIDITSEHKITEISDN